MIRKNIELRAEIMRAGLRNYEVGQRMGLTETRFSKLLNSELAIADRKRIMTAIAEIRSERGLDA